MNRIGASVDRSAFLLIASTNNVSIWWIWVAGWLLFLIAFRSQCGE
jgi:hypothetical protein